MFGVRKVDDGLAQQRQDFGGSPRIVRSDGEIQVRAAVRPSLDDRSPHFDTSTNTPALRFTADQRPARPINTAVASDRDLSRHHPPGVDEHR